MVSQNIPWYMYSRISSSSTDNIIIMIHCRSSWNLKSVFEIANILGAVVLLICLHLYCMSFHQSLLKASFPSTYPNWTSSLEFYAQMKWFTFETSFNISPHFCVLKSFFQYVHFFSAAPHFCLNPCERKSYKSVVKIVTGSKLNQNSSHRLRWSTDTSPWAPGDMVLHPKPVLISVNRIDPFNSPLRGEGGKWGPLFLIFEISLQ